MELDPGAVFLAAGYLEKEKRGAVIATSQRTRRYFVLTPTHLFFFRRVSPMEKLNKKFRVENLCGEQRGSIALADVLSVEVDPEPRDGMYSIAIKVDKERKNRKTLLLWAMNEDEAMDWQGELHRAMESVDSAGGGGARKLPGGSNTLIAVNKKHTCCGIVCLGFAHKKRTGTIRTGWALRQFVLTSTTLFYFRKIEGELFGEQRGVVPLRYIQSVTAAVTTHDDETFYDVTIKTDSPNQQWRSLHLRCTTKGERDAWVANLERCFAKAERRRSREQSRELKVQLFSDDDSVRGLSRTPRRRSRRRRFSEDSIDFMGRRRSTSTDALLLEEEEPPTAYELKSVQRVSGGLADAAARVEN